VNPARPLQAIDPDAARRAARHILSDRRFRRDPAPRPLRGVLDWIGDRLSPITRWLGRVFGDIFGAVSPWVWLVISLAVVVFFLARTMIAAQRRRATSSRDHHGRPRFTEAHEDADALEHAADRAERAGELDRAIRLRFRAGLIRLGDRGTIRYRPSVTTAEVRRVLGSETFDELARAFESIAYGGSSASPPDVEASRRDWRRVLDEAKRS
jgi:hypothetical protein